MTERERFKLTRYYYELQCIKELKKIGKLQSDNLMAEIRIINLAQNKIKEIFPEVF